MEYDLFYVKDKSFLNVLKTKFVYKNIRIKIVTDLKINRFVFSNRKLYKIYHNLDKYKKRRFRKMNVNQMIITCMMLFFVGSDKIVNVKNNQVSYEGTKIYYKR